MQLFYTTNINGDYAYLTEDEARHIGQVLRYKVGDTVQLTDGKGSLYQTQLVEIGKKTVVLKIENTIEAYNRRPFKLHIAIAPTKNIDRLEWFLEKTTEIGIEEITPLICQRSERTIVKIDRLRGILLAAMKQSLKAYLPQLNEPMDFKHFIKKEFNQNKKFIAYCNDDQRHPLSYRYQKGQDCVILIGPEGDFTESEVSAALALGYEGISLGDSRLRTETAGLVACHTVALLNNI
jgi:16S rRNA (uracil1498-N3)-methyltransferase